MIVYIIVVITLVLGRFYFKGRKAIRKNMTGKIVIITGASSGIGKESAFQLLKDGATVIFACRNKTKTLYLIEETKMLGGNCYERAIFMQLDLASFKSVDLFVLNFKSKFDRLDILLNNAGIGYVNYVPTMDGNEMNLQTNYLSHVRLTLQLLDIMKDKEARIINVSSVFAHLLSTLSDYVNNQEGLKSEIKTYQFKSIYSKFQGHFLVYANTKLFNIYFTSWLSVVTNNTDKWSHIKTVSLHPGIILSDFPNQFLSQGKWIQILFKIFYPALWYFMKTCYDGAQTQLKICYENNCDLKSGAYYCDLNEAGKGNIARNKLLQRAVMESTFEVLGMKEFYQKHKF